jgi:hypothetical protein
LFTIKADHRLDKAFRLWRGLVASRHRRSLVLELVSRLLERKSFTLNRPGSQDSHLARAAPDIALATGSNGAVDAR